MSQIDDTVEQRNYVDMKNNSNVTIFDIIKSMSVKQLSNFLESNINGCPAGINTQQCIKNGNDCANCWNNWLNGKNFF